MRVDQAGHHPSLRRVYDFDIIRVGDLDVVVKSANAPDPVALDDDWLIGGGFPSRTVDQRAVLDDEGLLPVIGHVRLSSISVDYDRVAEPVFHALIRKPRKRADFAKPAFQGGPVFAAIIAAPELTEAIGFIVQFAPLSSLTCNPALVVA